MDNTQPALTRLAEGADYELLASPDETTFVLRFKPEGMAAKLQGEDAARFRTDYAVVKKQYPSWTCDQTLAQLWDQGGYSWLASQDGA